MGIFFFFFHFGYFENTFKIFSVEVLYQSIFLFSYALKYTTLTHFPSHVATLIRLEMYCFWLPRIFPPSFPFFRSWCLTLLVIRVIIRPDLTNHNPLWNGCVIQAEPIRVLPWDYIQTMQERLFHLPVLVCWEDMNLGLSVAIFPI